MKKAKKSLSVWQILAIGYLIVILTGSVLLILPFATAEGHVTSYLGALFTATSATCVTGLTPYVTGAQWSLFGQIVILILIQLGGLGFMTFVTIILKLFRKGKGLNSRKTMMESAGGEKLSGVSELIKRIVIGSAIFEFLGAFVLCFRFVPEFGWGKGVYFSVFHSVSAFCNAGFDLFTFEGAGSLSHYAADPLVSVTIALLIIIGGLGFCVWGDVIDRRFRFSKFSLNTKVILVMSAILIVFPTFMFLGFEWNNPAYAGYNFWQRLLASFFNSVTPRTAGFFTTDPTSLSESGFLLTIVLMFIGGSSGSTAGGLKVGTIAIIIMGMWCVFRGNRDINIGKKRIDYSLLSKALAIFAALLMMLVISSIAICAIEGDGATAKAVMFECVSAICTVGLTLNLTPTLGVASQVIIILLMYMGRVGVLTLALALAKKRQAADIRYPVENILIG